MKKSLFILSAIPFAEGALRADNAFAQDVPAQPLDENDAQAKALGYVHDASKVDTAKFPKRGQPGGETQFCNNCALFMAGPVKLSGHEGEWGKCAIFPQGAVNAKGWCNSWSPKA